MSDRVFVPRCVVGDWTNWEPRWVLLHHGVYEYRELLSGDTEPLTFAALQEAVAWVRAYRPGWWLELPDNVLYGTQGTVTAPEQHL